MTQNQPNLFDRPLLHKRQHRAFAQDDFPDFLMRDVENELVERLLLIAKQFNHAIIIGPASADFAATIRATNKASHISHLSPIMPCDVLCDASQLALRSSSVDLIIAPLGLEWLNDLPGTLVQIRQSLKPDGLFLGSLLATGSLNELRQSWLSAESELYGGAGLRVAPFATVRDLGSLLQRAGFALPVADIDRLNVRYGSALKLMQELKAMGLANALHDRPRRPTTARLLAAACAYYHDNFADDDGKIRATFEICTLTAWAPDDSQQKPMKRGTAKMRLADALKTREIPLSNK